MDRRKFLSTSAIAGTLLASHPGNLLTKPKKVGGLINTGPQSLTLNTPTVVPNPLAEWGNAPTQVQVCNLSGFLINASAGGVMYLIQGYTALTLPLGQPGANLSLLPFAGFSAAPNNTITETWLLAGEISPMVDGSLTAAAIIGGIAGIVFTSPPIQLGTGSDGAVTIAVNTVLTHNMNYSSLTVNPGITLNTGGFIIYCTGTVTVNGTIDNSGTAGALGTAGAGGAVGSNFGGGAGSIPGNPPPHGASPGGGSAEGGPGGSGGLGVGTNNGLGGTVPPTTPGAVSLTGLLANTYGGGAGGSGATGAPAGYYGGGGGGGGVVMIFCSTLAGGGTISANGGAGGTGAPAGLGGGGGGGGIVFAACSSSTFTGTLSVAAGAAGTDPNGGGQTAGSPGISVLFV